MPRLIQRLELHNILSYGRTGIDIELQPLNVLIGPNAAGKSNLMEAIAILRAAPNDFRAPMSGEASADWVWKGGDASARAEIVADIGVPDGIGNTSTQTLRYGLAFHAHLLGAMLDREFIYGLAGPTASVEDHVLYEYGNRSAKIAVRDPQGPDGRRHVELAPSDFDWLQSVLSQRRDPLIYPELTYLVQTLPLIHFYRYWTFGALAPPRMAQSPSMRPFSLDEGAANLSVVLNAIEQNPDAWRKLTDYLRRVHPLVERAITAVALGGLMQVALQEQGLHSSIPASRVSDGTLRYLSLLAVLCHPTPPPLVCIEEPELGLHPDLVSTVAELLIDASERMQLIVTTHSDLLVSALSAHPGAVIVCDRDEAGTHLQRLDPERLRKWLERYSLGELWLKGELGGTRW